MTPCTHCGQPAVASETEDGPVFCCAGCATVWELMQAQGLGEFYSLRDRLGGGRPEGPASLEGRDEDAVAYAHYDDPDFLGRHAQGNHIQLHVDGLHCVACVWVFEQLPKVLPGVTSARLEYTAERLHLTWDPARIPLSEIGGFLHALGYATTPLGAEVENKRRLSARRELLRLAVAGAAAGNVMLYAIALYAGSFEEMDPTFARFFEWVSLLVTLPAITYAAMPFYRGAWAGLRMRVPHLDLPISLGLIGGFVASVYSTFTGHGEVYYDTLALLVFLLLLGRWVQHRGQRAALSGTELLAALTPGTAWRKGEGGFAPVPVDRLKTGDVVRVRAGEAFPVDGAIVRGESHADLSFLTGESKPVTLVAGSPVHAGATNVRDTVEVEVSATGASTRLGRLVAMIEQSETQRPPVLQTVHQLSGYFVIIVLVLAVAGGVAWAFIDPSRVFAVVVGLLVVSCPCALGLATPVALVVGRGRAARNGAVIRTTAALELLARTKRVVLDKTGTLTEGAVRVTEASVAPELVPALGALEARSAHPLARAVARWAKNDTDEVEGVTEHPSRGIEGHVAGRHLRVGSAAWLGAGPFEAQLAAVSSRGESPILVEVDGAVVGWLALGDRLRADASEALARLKKLGMELVVRSGDHPAAVAAVSARLGLHDARGHVSPEGKAADMGEWSAMVGDGVNDAPALRAATVGIAVAGGAETALTVADVYLTRPGLAAVADLFEGAHATMGLIRRNLGFSLAYNVVFATLALAGYITPLVAALIMPLSGLTVVTSSVLSGRLRRRTAAVAEPLPELRAADAAG